MHLVPVLPQEVLGSQQVTGPAPELGQAGCGGIRLSGQVFQVIAGKRQQV